MSLSVPRMTAVCILVPALLLSGLAKGWADENWDETATIFFGLGGFILAALVALLITTYVEKIQETSRRNAYVDGYPEMNERLKQAILNGEIFVGMTKEQLIASKGKPFEVDVSRTKDGEVIELFMYWINNEKTVVSISFGEVMEIQRLPTETTVQSR